MVGLGLEAGGPIARAAERAAATVRERAAVEREARALATQATTSAAVVACAPLAFALLAATVDPRVGAVLIGTPLGWMCLVGGVLLDAGGALWMALLVRRAS